MGRCIPVGSSCGNCSAAAAGLPLRVGEWNWDYTKAGAGLPHSTGRQGMVVRFELLSRVNSRACITFRICWWVTRSGALESMASRMLA